MTALRCTPLDSSNQYYHALRRFAVPIFPHMDITDLMTDDAYVEDKTGNRTGPFKTRFVGSQLTIFDQNFSGDEGDFLIQQMPGRRERKYRIVDVQYRTGLESIPSHFTIEIESKPVKLLPPMTTTNYNISGTNVQVGNNNTQQITSTLMSLISQIEQGAGTPEQKAEAKSKFRDFLDSPVAAAVLGSAVQVVATALGS